MMLNQSSINILGVKIHNLTIQEVLENVRSELKDSTSDHKNKQSRAEHITHVLPIYTVNPEFLVIAHEQRRFKEILNQAFVAVPDGIGILYAGLLKGKHFQQRITGIDLVHSLTKLAAEHDLHVGYLGGKENAAEETMNRFKKRYPSLNAWSDPGPKIEIVDSPTSSNSQKTLTKNIIIDQNLYDMKSLLGKISQTDIFFVGFGAPKQEFFIEWLKRYQVSGIRYQNNKTKEESKPTTYNLKPKTIVAVGVGGSFDEISGISPRTPKIIQTLGLKWLFRLVTEPWRWRRQIRLLKFIRLLLSKNNE